LNFYTQAMYGEGLSFVHEAGFGDFARGAAPGLIATLRRAGIRRGRVVELGCGAGAATKLLLRAGYEVLGVDASPEMVRLARINAAKGKFAVGRIPGVDLPPCDAVVAVGEVLNYMTRRADFDVLFRRVFAALRPDGIFIFDAKQPGRPGAPVVRGRAGKDWAVLAKSVEKKDGTLTREIVSFRRVGSTYRRSDEIHRLTLLPVRDLSRRLRAAGFTVRAARAYGAFRLPPGHVLVEGRRA
jgi:SAM-dependent methyltransferase